MSDYWSAWTYMIDYLACTVMLIIDWWIWPCKLLCMLNYLRACYDACVQICANAQSTGLRSAWEVCIVQLKSLAFFHMVINFEALQKFIRWRWNVFMNYATRFTLFCVWFKWSDTRTFGPTFAVRCSWIQKIL
jgi:hypothetical protein